MARENRATLTCVCVYARVCLRPQRKITETPIEMGANKIFRWKSDGGTTVPPCCARRSKSCQGSSQVRQSSKTQLFTSQNEPIHGEN